MSLGSTASYEALKHAATAIEIAAAKLGSYLDQTCEPLLQSELDATFTGLGGSINIPFDAPHRIKDAKSTVLEATTTIQQLLTTSFEFQRQLATQNQHAACIRWLCCFNIPSLIPEHPGGINFSTLVLKAALPEASLARICLMATTAGFFHCPNPNTVAHTPISLSYRSPAALLDTMLFLTETGMPTAYNMVDMTVSQLDTLKSMPRTAFQIAHDTEVTFFPYLSQNPKIAQRLASGMKDISAGAETHVQHLVDGFDWASLGTAHVVDIGGSMGHASIALAKAFPDLTFTVQDLPPVIAQAQKQTLDTDLRDRVHFEVHNFLTPQPRSSSSVDIFLIRQCLQNHPHQVAVKILQNVAPCLQRPNCHLIINNIVVPTPGDISMGKREEATIRTRDLFMMQAMDGQERDMGQWKQLLKEADERLEIAGVRKPRGSGMSVLDVMPRRENGSDKRVCEERASTNVGFGDEKVSGISVRADEISFKADAG